MEGRKEGRGAEETTHLQHNTEERLKIDKDLTTTSMPLSATCTLTQRKGTP
jgi:hypothetical protein